MKVTVELTEEFTEYQGRYCRICRGKDQDGRKLYLLVVDMFRDPTSTSTEADKVFLKQPKVIPWKDVRVE
jgi:hypothetical protein